MCDYFLQRMEGDQAGDLADIVRAGGAGGFPSTASECEWPLAAEPILFQRPPRSSSDGAGPPSASGADAFGDQLSGLPNPFGGDYPSSSSGGGGADFDAAHDAADAGMVLKSGFIDASAVGAGGVLDMMKPILPRGVHMAPAGVSPLTSPRTIRPYPVMGGEAVKLGVPMAAVQAAGPCSFDAFAAGMQMPSPRAGGIKRRKNQARKVVCIPAPAAAGGGRTSGDVVPSDLWAWRKYGQKPIKGSPYPRGYYRCSSSKGCSARKQVERSRTDPNMLVITYTSEHNHPWPTQRNALAGSTRSHHQAKNGGGGSASASNIRSSHTQLLKPIVKAERKDQAGAAAAVAGSGGATASTTATTSTTTTATTTSTSNTPPTMAVKEETPAAVLLGSSEMERRCVLGDDSAMAAVDDHMSDLMQQMFSQSYRPMIPEVGQHDDFFADLAELESDPMSLIFSKEYMESKPPDGDPFMLDWAPTTTVTTSAGSSFEQRQRGL